jgi:hypothetical protein
MKCIPEATPITLTEAERAELGGLVRSRRTRHRVRQRARIVLLAADGVATGDIGRTVGCTTGTAPKGRVRDGAHRLAGFDKAGNSGSVAKYGTDTTRRILRVLDLVPLPGHGRWTGLLIANALGDVDMPQVWRAPRAQKIDPIARKS